MNTISIVALWVFLPFVSSAQNIAEFTSAMNSGDAIKIASMIDSTTNLQIEQKRSRACKQEAEKLLQDFFIENPGTKLEIRHSGNRNSGNGAFYKIGTLTSGSNSFRVFVLFETKKDQLVIQELSIERD
ncbi:MAG: DUF4783 domain-containing protein [Saprospirales bacterium]|nr:MAG: DUF4783 domain-containing protein [Saprospirales bacterium]